MLRRYVTISLAQRPRRRVCRVASLLFALSLAWSQSPDSSGGHMKVAFLFIVRRQKLSIDKQRVWTFAKETRRKIMSVESHGGSQWRCCICIMRFKGPVRAPESSGKTFLTFFSLGTTKVADASIETERPGLPTTNSRSAAMRRSRSKITEMRPNA